MNEFKNLFDIITKNEFEKLHLKFVSINKSQNLVKATFVTKEKYFNIYNTQENLEKIREACNTVFEEVNVAEVIIKIPYVTDELLKKQSVNFIEKTQPLLSKIIDFTSITIKDENEDKVKINITIDDAGKNIVKEVDFENKYKDFLCREFAIEANIEIDYKTFTEKEIETKKEIEAVMYDSTIDKLKLEIREQVYGKIESKYATKLKDLKTGIFPSVCVAGMLTSIKSFKSKKNKMIYNLDIQDDSGTFSITVFSELDNDGPPFDSLIIKETYAFEGFVKYNDYKKRNSMVADKIALVKIDNSISEEYFTNIIKDEYQLIKPVKFDLPNMNAAVSIEDYLLAPNKEECPEVLKGKTFVVFDLETTGLNREGEDKITEIAAIKIVDGEKVEIFETLVNPEKTIPTEVALKTGITNEMVQNMPKINEIVHDFFKFIGDAALVGHNAIDFDIPFLNVNVKNYKYKIKDTTPVYDTLLIARKTIQTPTREYRLEKLAEFLNVDLTNAHRAKYDTLATAEIFLYIAKNYPEELKPF